MNKIKDTSKNPNPEWLLGGNPNAIEAQEAQGQKELEASIQLPRDINYPRDADAKETYTKAGITVIGESKGDDLFFDVKLPEGWQLKATDHSMWSQLLDEKGRERAMIFYKAAFYDRSSHISFNHRYSCTTEWDENKPGEYLPPRRIVVKDNADNSILFETERINPDDDPMNMKETKFTEQCKQYLKDNYPNHEDINEYWD